MRSVDYVGYTNTDEKHFYRKATHKIHACILTMLSLRLERGILACKGVTDNSL